MAKGGNVIGSIGPLVLYTAITLYISWTLVNKSYTLGRNSILSLLKTAKLSKSFIQRMFWNDDDGRFKCELC